MPTTPDDPFIATIASGAAPAATWVDGPRVVELGLRGGLVDLAGRAPPDVFWGPAWAQIAWRGTAFALPITADPNFLLVADRASIAGRVDATPWDVYGKANALFTWGGDAAALDWIIAASSQIDVRAVAESLRPPPGDDRHPFLRRKVANAPLGSWEIAGLRDSGIDYAIAPLPSPGQPWIGGWCLGLTPGAGDDAWRLVEWATSTRDGAGALGELHLAFSAFKDNPWLATADRDPDLARFAALLRGTTRHRPPHPLGGLRVDLLDMAVDDAVRGRKPAGEALAMVEGAVERKLAARRRAIPLT